MAGTFTVTAASVADQTKTSSTQVTVKAVISSVNVTPNTAVLKPGESLKFAASVSGLGITDSGVKWTASGGSIAADGTFTAPAESGNYTVIATSLQDSAKSGLASIRVKGWVVKWTRDVVYVGTREIAEVDTQGAHYTLTDHLGSPRFIVNGQGQVESEQKFLPFGESLTDATSAAKFAKGFTNHEQTDPSGLIYMQARFYAPWYGRFLSPDPARDQHFEETQSWNIYSYVRNGPVSNVDFTGQWSTPTHELINRQVFSGKDLKLINRSSLRVDGGRTTLLHGAQSQKNSYQHGMRSPKQTPEEAQKAAMAYKEKAMASAVQKEADGDHKGAMAELGKVTHLVQDMTSPQHEEFQVWGGLIHLGDALDHHNAEQQSEKDGLNSDAVKSAVTATKAIKSEFDTRVQQERERREIEKAEEAKEKEERK
ncbi:RHS repeat-associated core domain-containing protein [Geothrix sp. 21YS21S-4]|uniref:RHS repeat-associated core domain-containing protein n=1 Tax=Geothrix sp. 21YS21S-4 TaxID=3068889 RepID=UPI0027B93DD4|nr:RHS repeat-associated core domain-containing protein [Geothrix sp. 21YS21S-4]